MNHEYASRRGHSYTIVPLLREYAEEICQDAAEQIQTGVADCALFSMPMAPEGIPPIDKAGILCGTFDVMREKMAEKGAPCGILIQATIGHNYYQNKTFPFTRYTQLTDGKEINTCCPYDEGFRDYIRSALRTAASHRPAVIMVDDDFRLLARPGKGCACPRHMAALNRRMGTNITREILWEEIQKESPLGIRWKEQFIQVQRESLLLAAKAMREGIDSVDPSIPGCFCACGDSAEFAGEIAKILAGEGNPSVVRINNGFYCKPGFKGMSQISCRAASQIQLLKDTADILLAETDTCPQNRYSTGAYVLHSHFTASILEGAAGAKHWITKMNEFEPECGKAYRAVLKKYRGFYDRLMALTPTLRWVGCGIPLRSKPDYGFGAGMSDGWYACTLERLGLPIYFTTDPTGPVFLDEFGADAFTREEILNFFARGAVLSVKALERLNAMGYEAWTGVRSQSWEGEKPEFERVLPDNRKCSLQKELRQLIPVAEGVRADSWVYSCTDGKTENPLFPGSTVFRNPAGGLTAVFCGTPKTEYNFREAFSFLNATRKKQLVRLLREMGALPAYYPEDAEIYFRAAEMEDGGLFCVLFNIGPDPLEEIPLCLDRSAKRILRILPDGRLGECGFRVDGEGVTWVETEACSMAPVVLLVK